ncbi:uncharacterized protein TRIADDRAFT_64337 [Trichoplax adhaerens]|uniref:Aftiphilin clathrin-binding box domain-containing protein n=1 Tax=Trichoplax adhaerens TaxID=10228 RepID=B3SAJ4_TRIAD|nr:hypothetical protein TRIADDRAFT_64337 [Trichoplax adhaerens]EDV20321.1 hypothetical protein TRIADDRAFT_64337 [Trichoplax adhaerens]|eukprot:XP_002117271.1 hypothetical protein TRIADDRAFT_64337 [Trichoplax adhaerens]
MDENDDEFDSFQSGFHTETKSSTTNPIGVKQASQCPPPAMDMLSSSPPDFDGPPPLTTNEYGDEDDFAFPSVLSGAQFDFQKPQGERDVNSHTDQTELRSDQENRTEKGAKSNTHNVENKDVKSETHLPPSLPDSNTTAGDDFVAFPSFSNDDSKQQINAPPFSTESNTAGDGFTAFASFSNDTTNQSESNWFAADFSNPSTSSKANDYEREDDEDLQWGATFPSSSKPETQKDNNSNFDQFSMLSSPTTAKEDTKVAESKSDSPPYIHTPPPLDDLTDRQDSLDIGPTTLTDFESDYPDTAFASPNYKPSNLFPSVQEQSDIMTQSKENTDTIGQINDSVIDTNAATETLNYPFASSESGTNDGASLKTVNLDSDQKSNATVEEKTKKINVNATDTASTNSGFQANFTQQAVTERHGDEDDLFHPRLDRQDNENTLTENRIPDNSTLDSQNSINQLNTNKNLDQSNKLKAGVIPLESKESNATEKQAEDSVDHFGDFNLVQQPTVSKKSELALIDKTDDNSGHFGDFKSMEQNTTVTTASSNADDFTNFGDFKSTDQNTPLTTTSNDTDDFANFGDLKSTDQNTAVTTTSNNTDDFASFGNLKSTERNTTVSSNTDDFANFGDFKSMEQNVTVTTTSSNTDDFANFGDFKSPQQNTTAVDTSSNTDDSANFGDSKLTQQNTAVADTPSFSSTEQNTTEIATSKNADDYANFRNFKSVQQNNSNKVDNLESAKSANIPATNDFGEDGFGDFKSLHPSTTTVEDNSSSAGHTNDDDDFGDFETPQNNNTINEKPNTLSADDDFGDFETPQNYTLDEKPKVLPKDDDFGDFETPQNYTLDEKPKVNPNDDDFGEFGEFKSPGSTKNIQDKSLHKSNFSNVSTAKAPGIPKLPQHSNSNLSMKAPAYITSTLIQETVNQTFQTKNNKIVNGSNFQLLEKELYNRNRCNKMWKTIIETEQDYTFVWTDSCNQKSLLNSVGVDLKALTIKMDPNKQAGMQDNFGNAFGELDDFLGGAMSSPGIGKPTPSSTMIKSNPSTTVFDFLNITESSSESVNTKREESKENKYMDIFSLTMEDSVGDKGLYEKDLLNLGISPLQTPVKEKKEQSNAAHFIAFVRNSSTESNENLSDEAKSILAKLPDLSFMLSKTIAFPSLPTTG